MPPTNPAPRGHGAHAGCGGSTSAWFVVWFLAFLGGCTCLATLYAVSYVAAFVGIPRWVQGVCLTVLVALVAATLLVRRRPRGSVR